MLKLDKKRLAKLKTVLEKGYNFILEKMTRVPGFYDANFILQTSRGCFFAKVYGFDKLSAIQFQTSLIEVLYRANLPVGKLTLTSTGKQYFKFEKTHGIVQSFIDGRKLGDEKITLVTVKEL